MSAYVIFGPDGAVTESCTDNGDGTGTRTTYDDKGTVVETETITGLPIPEVDDTPADPAAVLADLAARLAAIPATATSATVRTELRTIGTDLLSALTPWREPAMTAVRIQDLAERVFWTAVSAALAAAHVGA